MREIFRELAIQRQRQYDAHDERAWLAWHVAALSGQQKLPKLETLLARPNLRRAKRAERRAAAVRQAPSADQRAARLARQREALHMLSAYYGLPYLPANRSTSSSSS
jgi:hypothetical protein